MNSAGVFAVSNVRSMLIGVNNWRGMFRWMVLGHADSSSPLAREDGWAAAKITVFWRLGRGDKTDGMDCNPSRMSFACEIVKATGYLFRARTLVKLVTRKRCGATNEIMA